MSIPNVLRRISRMTSKQAMTAGVFAIAMAGAVGLGLAVKQNTMAATVRDTGTNPIINTGSIGCLTAAECIADMRANNPNDLQAIYNHFGLSPSEYDRFAQTARMGTTYKDGRVVVDGQTVIEGAWSTGRNKFNGQREAYTINGKTYYKSPTTSSFASNSIQTLVMFDANGDVETAVLTACGNPVWGTKKTPQYSCDMLTKAPVAGKKNTYTFNAAATATNNASIVRYEFDFGDGTKKSSTSNTIEHAYPSNVTKKYIATVKVIVKLPGNQEKEVVGANCKTETEVLAPFYACVNLMAATNDPKKQKFTFTVKTNAGNGAKLESADFTFDGNVTVSGVKPNSDGTTATTERTFTDSAKHKIVAKVNFNVDGDIKSVNCQTEIESTKTPVCVINGKEYPYPPDDERCKELCEKGYPVGDERCNPTPAPDLPDTGAGNVAGIFLGTSAIGAVAHRVFQKRRTARKAEQNIL